MSDDPVYGDRLDDNSFYGYNDGQQGVFGLHPLATPKYAINKGHRDAEFKETLARMYISMASSDPNAKKAYLASLPSDPRVRALAEVLTGHGQSVQTGFIDFFLQQVTESFQESRQIDKVLGDNYVAFYFGHEPPVFSYAGSLLNSMQDDQRTGFALAYQHLLRGTQLARRGALLRLRYDNVIVSGTIDQHSQVINAENEMIVPFNFTMLVKEYVILPTALFSRTSASDYVELATAFAADSLIKSSGSVQDKRVRTWMYTADVLSEDVALPGESGAISSQLLPEDVVEGAANGPSKEDAKINNDGLGGPAPLGENETPGPGIVEAPTATQRAQRWLSK